MPVSLIAAVAANGVIGRDGELPWHLPEDLRRFKALTTGHHLIVGRSTWESVGRPLPDRTFVVVSRAPGDELPGLTWVRSVGDGIRRAIDAGDLEPFVAGGGGIYREALERALVDRLYLTRIERAYAGDARFPAWEPSEWRLVEREPHPADPQHDRPAFEFQRWERARGESAAAVAAADER